MGSALLDMPGIGAVSHLDEAHAWSTRSRSVELVRTIMGSHLARLMNVDHSVLR